MEIHGGENEEKIYLDVRGHAKASSDGLQYPCSKISILTQSLSTYLFDRLGEHCRGVEDRAGQGFLFISVRKKGLHEDELEDVRTMWNMLKAGLDIVEYQYPCSFVLAWERKK